jgi:hypothetical protein
MVVNRIDSRLFLQYHKRITPDLFLSGFSLPASSHCHSASFYPAESIPRRIRVEKLVITLSGGVKKNLFNPPRTSGHPPGSRQYLRNQWFRAGFPSRYTPFGTRISN